MTSPNIIVSIKGEPKNGKTHFALSFPDPISLISLDLGAKPIIAKFPKKKITLRELPMPLFDSLTTINAGFDDFWAQVKEVIYKDIDSGDYNTIIIDTASALWEVIRYAFNEEQGKEIGAGGKARNYGEPNARMYGIVTKAQLAGVNLVLINYLKDKWENDVNTGKQVIDGWRRTEALADIVLLNEKVTGAKGSEFKTTITDCRFDPTLDGTVLNNATYEDLMLVLGL